MKTILAIALAFLSVVSIAQEGLNTHHEFLPSEADSNNFYYYVRAGYVIPFKETTSFQKNSLGPGFTEGPRLFNSAIEMLLYPSRKYDRELNPHILFRADVFPNQYLSSRFGFGISSRRMGSSFGVFVGQYFRRVPYEANFVTRRKRTFEHYPLHGFYLQSSSKEASFVGSFAFERRNVFHSVRISGNLGDIANMSGALNGLRLTLLSESYTGSGIGPSIVFGGTTLETLFIFPDKREQQIEARLRNKLTRGFLVSISHTVR
jgi:hypothetical protein